jgi:hypothetical protein
MSLNPLDSDEREDSSTPAAEQRTAIAATSRHSVESVSPVFEDWVDKHKPIEEREDRFLSESERRQKPAVIRAKSKRATSKELDTFLRSRAHLVKQAALKNRRLTAEQILDFAENRVKLDHWGGEYTHEWQCLKLILSHPNTPESILRRVANFSGTYHEFLENVFAHPNCPSSLIDEFIDNPKWHSGPSLAKSPHLTEEQALALVRDTVTRDKLEESSSRRRIRADDELSVEQYLEIDLSDITETEKDCHINLAQNEKVSLGVLRQIEPGDNTELIAHLAGRFHGDERESLLDRLEALAPKSKETLLTVARLTSNPAKLSELCLMKNKAVRRAVAANPSTSEEDKVLIALTL